MAILGTVIAARGFWIMRSRPAEGATLVVGGSFVAGLAWYWLLPLPNANEIWVNFRSPLLWDVFAVSTYGVVSFLFWYLGLVPDLAAATATPSSKCCT